MPRLARNLLIDVLKTSFKNKIHVHEQWDFGPNVFHQITTITINLHAFPSECLIVHDLRMGGTAKIMKQIMIIIKISTLK